MGCWSCGVWLACGVGSWTLRIVRKLCSLHSPYLYFLYPCFLTISLLLFLFSLNRAFHFCMNDYIVLVFFSYLCHGVFLSLLSMMLGTFKSLAAKSYAGIYVCQNFCVIPFFFLAFSLYFRCVFFFLVLSVIFSCELFGFAFGFV